MWPGRAFLKSAQNTNCLGPSLIVTGCYLSNITSLRVLKMRCPAGIRKLLATLLHNANGLSLITARCNRPCCYFVKVNFGYTKLLHILLDHVLALLSYRFTSSLSEFWNHRIPSSAGLLKNGLRYRLAPSISQGCFRNHVSDSRNQLSIRTRTQFASILQLTNNNAGMNLN